MEFKGTGGEWKIGKKLKRGYKFLDAEGSGDQVSWESFCRVVTHVDGQEDEEGVANLKLIAAAPKLLEACIEAYKYMDDGDEPIRGEIKKAIEKALK